MFEMCAVYSPSLCKTISTALSVEEHSGLNYERRLCGTTRTLPRVDHLAKQGKKAIGQIGD